MTELVLRIFHYLQARRWLRLTSLLVSTLLLVVLVLRLNYKEDISDFLPLDSQHAEALRVYQDVAGAGKLFAIFQYRDTTKADPDAMVAAIDDFTSRVADADTAGITGDVVARIDMERLTEVADFVYTNIPYFLTDADYARMDSALAQPDFVAHQMEQDKQLLMFPTGGLLSDNIQRDPLNLFTPVVQRLQGAGSGMRYETHDGCIFSPDMQRAIVIINSPFGASETENNTRLLTLLAAQADSTMAQATNVDIHLTGGPAIAVGNSSQIKTDSMISVGLAVVLILALLLVTFRNLRNLLLIALSIAWGWLFAMGGLALVHDSVSIIVVGISSVIVGIAVNYPLHYIAHLGHTPDKAKALREIVMPLVVGNVTTVGAFLALVPLQSVALRDLGLFASFLLVGTIVFVLLYLPHLSAVRQQSHHTVLDRIGEVSLEDKPWVVAVVVVLTLVFGVYSFRTTFDANMSHINYMTDQQKADMEYFSSTMLQAGSTQTVYALSTDTTLEGALDKSLRLQPTLHHLVERGEATKTMGCSQFLCSQREQARRLALWQQFVTRHHDQLTSQLQREATRKGFSADAFEDFEGIVAASYAPQQQDYFTPLSKAVFAANISADSTNKNYSVVDVVSINKVKGEREKVKGFRESVKEQLSSAGAYAFDVESMNSAIANHLSDDFNYIGWACGGIVFFFLWLSLGSLELAMLSFVPMAISWVWILGIMGMCGIEFNIVNVILATFIFGQGDDYTIFMTEGASYEYAYRRKMLASYKHSIIVSALIMFIGIGSLIVAKHPALHSLAQVTIAGMFSVVLMAYIFPPLIFRLLVRSRHGYRRRPLTLRALGVMALAATVFFAQLFTVYLCGFVLLRLLHATPSRRQWLRRYVSRLFRFDLHHIPGVRFVVDGITDDTFAKPSMVICNHQSMLDAAFFMALSPRCTLVANGHASTNWVIRHLFQWLGFITLTDDIDRNLLLMREAIGRGESVVVFPEGERNARSSILRFHKGACLIADTLQLDVQTIVLHGANMVLPRNSVMAHEGCITLRRGRRFSTTELREMGSITERTKGLHAYYVAEYQSLKEERETADYFRPLVLDRYRYKGYDIMAEVKKNLKHLPTDRYTTPEIHIDDHGYGETALAVALAHPTHHVVAALESDERAEVLRYSAEGITDNITITTL